MSWGKSFLFLLSIGWLGSLLLFPGLARGVDVSDDFLSLHPGSPLAAEAFISMTESFAQMSISLVGQEYDQGFYLIHATTREELLAELQKAGFSSSLSTRLTAAYLYWNPDLQRLVLVPTDSIPYIKPEDRKNTKYFVLNDKTIVFQLSLFDYFGVGDHYSIWVSCIQEAGRWSISEWHWAEVH